MPSPSARSRTRRLPPTRSEGDAAMIRDMMPNFELLQPTKLADALSLLDRRGKDIWKMAGGNDSLDWFKDRVKRPKVVMDLGGIAELRGIRETADGVEIGALTTLSEIANNKVIREKFKVLADAAGRVASPQIRNASSIGGNVSQDARWHEPRARDLRRRPLHCGQPVGHRAGVGGARGEDGDQDCQERAGGRC